MMSGPELQHLFAARSSLVAPTGRLTSDEDVKRLFHQMASNIDDEAGESSYSWSSDTGGHQLGGL